MLLEVEKQIKFWPGIYKTQEMVAVSRCDVWGFGYGYVVIAKVLVLVTVIIIVKLWCVLFMNVTCNLNNFIKSVADESVF